MINSIIICNIIIIIISSIIIIVIISSIFIIIIISSIITTILPLPIIIINYISIINIITPWWSKMSTAMGRANITLESFLWCPRMPLSMMLLFFLPLTSFVLQMVRASSRHRSNWYSETSGMSQTLVSPPGAMRSSSLRESWNHRAHSSHTVHDVILHPLVPIACQADRESCYTWNQV